MTKLVSEFLKGKTALGQCCNCLVKTEGSRSQQLNSSMKTFTVFVYGGILVGVFGLVGVFMLYGGISVSVFIIVDQ